MQMPKLSPKAMLAINLLLGVFVTLTNGGAVVVSLSGGKGQLRGGELHEAAVWAAAGIAIIALSVLGLARPQAAASTLEKQALAVFALIGVLAVWGLTVATGIYRIEGAVIWSAGFLSILGLYCYLLYDNVSSLRGWAKTIRPFAIAFVIGCIAIDIAAFFAVIRS